MVCNARDKTCRRLVKLATIVGYLVLICNSLKDRRMYQKRMFEEFSKSYIKFSYFGTLLKILYFTTLLKTLYFIFIT